MAEIITPCLWFDGQAEEAVTFYVSLFPNSRIDRIVRSPVDYPGGTADSVLTIEFTLAGRPFMALNGGPYFKFNEAVSLSIACADQAEVDRLWEALSADPAADQCGWVKDRYGLSWQIIPDILTRLIGDPDPARAARVMRAMMDMKKIDIAAIERAAAQ
jgi:predicted 3-demethylubiquinone-9 3-methyltransferase (glyoxalase superfamily)